MSSTATAPAPALPPERRRCRTANRVRRAAPRSPRRLAFAMDGNDHRTSDRGRPGSGRPRKTTVRNAADLAPDTRIGLTITRRPMASEPTGPTPATTPTPQSDQLREGTAA